VTEVKENEDEELHRPLAHDVRGESWYAERGNEESKKGEDWEQARTRGGFSYVAPSFVVK